MMRKMEVCHHTLAPENGASGLPEAPYPVYLTQVTSKDHFKSKRSSSITLTQAATKSVTNF